MIFPDVRRLLAPLSETPLHPQWLITRATKNGWQSIANQVEGRLLDIGCGNKPLSRLLSSTVEYIGLDYPPTVAKGYGGEADVFGDGQSLPFRGASFDAVTMLDVLEHVPQPERAFSEMVRVVRPGGVIITRTPFMYPLHDLPHDFQRWTSEGLKGLGSRHAVELVDLDHYGRSLESAAVLANLAMAKGMLDSVKYRTPAVLLMPLVALAVPMVNLGGWLLARCFRSDDFMPLGYTAIFRKSPDGGE